MVPPLTMMVSTDPQASDDLESWVARVLEALCEAKAWFRHGLTAREISERSGVPLRHVFAACRSALSEGYLEVNHQTSKGGLAFSLTPRGVATFCRLPGRAATSEEGPETDQEDVSG